MRVTIVAAAWLYWALLCGCSSDSGHPTLTIVPEGTAGTVAITGPTVFSVQLSNGDPLSADDTVTWNATAGALSSQSGLHVTLTPPLGTSTATLSAVMGRLSATLQVASSPASMAAVTMPGLGHAVTVAYDAQDVPHIQCAAAADCLAVQGYLQARDRLFPMDFLRHVAEGRVAEMIGAQGLTQDPQMRVLFLTRDGKRVENELVKAIDETTRALLDAYVGGINAYINELKASSGALPGEYAQLPFHLTAADIDLWTEQDTLAIARLNQFQLSQSLSNELANYAFRTVYGADDQKMAAWIRAAAPTTEQAHTLSSSGPARLAAMTRPARKRARSASDLRRDSRWNDVVASAATSLAALGDALRPFDGSIGSNNWVVSAAKSSTHTAMVANDPHLMLQYPPLFHLATMTSTNPADNLNITGGSFPGIPGALVGRGAHVGWGVTVVGYDVTDVYLEDFPEVRTCPDAARGIPCVMLGTEKRSVIVLDPSTDPTARFRVRTASGIVDDARTLDPKTLPAPVPPQLLVVPHHGPVVGPPKGLDATHPATGMSFRWTGHEPNTQDLKAFYGLATAANVDAAMDALKDYATGAQNFVLADDSGNIAYDPHAFVPKRPFAVPNTPNPPWFPLTSDGTTEWGDDPVACAAPNGIPASCWIADADLPHGKNPDKGYYFTANADPTSLVGDPARGVSDDNNPLAHPPYLSFDWDDSSGFRATRIEQVIKERLAANGTISPGDMESIQADHVSRPGMAFAPFIAAIDASTRPAEVGAAKQILATWASNGFDCPSGVTGSDPKASAADATPLVVQNSSGCFLFHEFLRTVVTNVFADDLARAGQGVNGLAAVKALLFMLGSGGANSSFCNNFDATTGQTATVSCSEQVALALGQAYRTLSTQVSSDPTKWTWGRVHTIQPVSLLPLVTSGYAPGPYARPGGAFTVDVGNPNLGTSGLDFAYASGGNVRHISIMDPAKARVRMQLPGPERDGPAAGGGPDLLGQWVKNSYFDYASGDQINAVAVTTQTFNGQ